MLRNCRNILVADHTGTCGDIPPLLLKNGYNIHRSANIVDTVALIQDKKPDLVILRPSVEPVPKYEFLAVLHAIPPPQSLFLALEKGPQTEEEEAICAKSDDFFVGNDFIALLARINVLARKTKRTRYLTARMKKLEEESITDFKTELFNDRYILRRLHEEFDRSQRHRLTLSIIMLDLDEFKRINDTLGHHFGDFVLLSFSRKLKSLIRKIDIPGRLGGDEFITILPNTGLDEAVRIADRIRSIVNGYKFERDGVSTNMTVSIGINSYAGDGSITCEEFLKGVDQGLIEAKNRGKNRIFLYPQHRLKNNGADENSQGSGKKDGKDS